MIVSKDTDFRERSYVEGFPPKVIWLDVGTAGTVAIAELLRRERQRILNLAETGRASVLPLAQGTFFSSQPMKYLAMPSLFFSDIIWWPFPTSPTSSRPTNVVLTPA